MLFIVKKKIKRKMFRFKWARHNLLWTEHIPITMFKWKHIYSCVMKVSPHDTSALYSIITRAACTSVSRLKKYGSSLIARSYFHHCGSVLCCSCFSFRLLMFHQQSYEAHVLLLLNIISHLCAPHRGSVKIHNPRNKIAFSASEWWRVVWTLDNLIFG